jgi:GT2 family glycosyltransferase
MNEFPIVTVITPNWNTSVLLIEFLDSIKLQSYPLNKIEIIVIDNGSDDDSVLRINNWFVKNELFYRTELVALNKNYGIATAYNKGFEISSPESRIIIRTESDVELDKDSIKILIETLSSNKTIGLVGARGVLYSNRNKIDHAARFMNWRTGKLSGIDPDVLVECDCVFGGTFAVQKDLIHKMGYFFKLDRFLASEMEMCTRVKFAGFKVVCNPLAVSYHKVGNTTSKMKKKKFSFIDTRELTLFHLEFNKSLNKLTSVLLIFIASIKQLLTLNIFALRGFFSAIFSNMLNKNVLLPSAELKKLSEWMIK